MKQASHIHNVHTHGPRLNAASSDVAAHTLDWQRKMSNNIAFALLVYTGLQIFVTMSTMKSEGTSLVPYLALIILVAAIIPACRRFERRWNILARGRNDDPALAGQFRHDRLILWLMAVGLPFALAGIFKGLALVFA